MWSAGTEQNKQLLEATTSEDDAVCNSMAGELLIISRMRHVDTTIREARLPKFRAQK